MKEVTATWLRDHEACEDQVRVFEVEWPDGTEVNEAAVQRALELNLDIGWFAMKWLSPSALKAYNEAMARAPKVYDEAMARAPKVYDEARAPALKAYNEAMARALKAYNEAMARALKAYNEAMARALVAALGVRA